MKGVALLLIPISGFSQFNLFRNFNVKDGLPSSEVYEMLEDSKGYFWFATDMGVSRFNGYAFENFSTENGLPDNTVYGIYEDHKKNIWFRSLSGKLSYYKNNEIQTLPCNNELEHLFKNLTITSVFVDSRDTIWLGVNSNFILKIGPGRHRQDVKKVPVKNDGLYVYEIEDHFVYGGQVPDKHLISLYEKKGMLLMSDTNQRDFHKNARYCVKRLHNKTYLATINNIIVNFNNKGIIYRHESEHFNICQLEDENNAIIIGTFGGLNIVNKNGYQPDRAYKMLDQKIITALHRDKEKELWICTKGHGVFYIPYQNFKYYTPVNGLPESSISCISVIGDHVLAGHLNGQVSVFDGTDLKVMQLANKDSSIGRANEVTSLLDFDADTKFIGSINSIYKFDSKTNTAKVVHDVGSKKTIRLKSNGKLMSLGFRILRIFDPLSFDIKEKVWLPNYCDNIFEDSKGNIWICSSKGICIYDRTAKLKYPGEKDTLLTSRIVDVKEGQKGQMWFATRGEGVILKNGDKLFQIRQKDGLSSNMCRTLYLESENVVWAATNNGLNKIVIESYEPLRYSVKNYSSKNGLLTNEVNYIIKFKNNLWLAHNNGISVFDPEHIQDNTTPPAVYITKILVNEINLGTDKAVSLTHDENYLTINYNGLSFKDPGQIEYKHKLEGLDTNWIYTNYTSVNFQGVSPGKYRFIVYAKNNDGYWSTKPATFEFIIEPAWWQTWWFILLILLAIITIGVIVFLYRLKFVEKRERLKTLQLTRLSNAELKALRSQMNPHFVFNAINSVQYFITNNDPASSQKYLSKFAKLIRYVVDNSKPAAIPLSRELEALNLYLDLESLRFENKFEYNINVAVDVDTENIQIPSMLIQPFVENAIWHGLMHKGSKGKININISLKDQVLICVIEDNGIGRKRSQEILKEKNSEFHKSVGMSITQERLDIINQKNNSNLTMKIIDLENSKGESIGTRVELILPFN